MRIQFMVRPRAASSAPTCGMLFSTLQATTQASHPVQRSRSITIAHCGLFVFVASLIIFLVWRVQIPKDLQDSLDWLDSLDFSYLLTSICSGKVVPKRMSFPSLEIFVTLAPTPMSVVSETSATGL